MKPYNDLRKEFEAISQSQNVSSDNISAAHELLQKTRAAGQNIKDAVEREKYAQIARDTSEILFNATGELLPARLDLFEGTVVGGNASIIASDNNTVNQTFIQKIFNIFKSDAEPLEQRNRRILLNHVENAWIKGVLDASLYGAAMLELGIKETPEAITNKYPWALKKEATDKILPAGTSMLEIFDSIGMGRSLLILGAPGSGKTTMLLELARGLIARAREDVTQPISMVFNLASWTEKLSLADWLAQELNNLYSVPRKTAPDWVRGNKLLFLLDGLDEVPQVRRAKCVEAINEFRKNNGLTSIVVCSRSQDYGVLNARLSFEGAIEIQPLTSNQVDEYFKRFGEQLTGIRQVLKRDNALRELIETPLLLSIMILAYRDMQSANILSSENLFMQRKHLLDAYIGHMFDRGKYSENEKYKRQDILNWLSWLAKTMIENNKDTFSPGTMKLQWLDRKQQGIYKLIAGLIYGLVFGLIFGLLLENMFGLFTGLIGGMILGLSAGLIGGLNIIHFGIVKNYSLRLLLSTNNLLPWRLVPFLDHCVDLIFLRRVGGGYIFIHRLLMEHFAEMYMESPKSKGI